MRKGVLSLTSTILAILLAAVATVAAGTLAAGTKPAGAAFPGKNGKIVFASNRHGGWEIYTISPARKNLKRLTDNPAKNVDPTWSADGKRIAFTNGRNRRRAFDTYDIFVMNANGSGKTRVTKERKPGTEKWHDTAPSFSPNGRQIVFKRVDALGGNIYKIRTDGSNLTRLTRYDSDHTQLGDPAWSPDGSKIIFGIADLSSASSYLATISPDGSKHSRFSDGLGVRSQPDWSPHGSRVVYVGEHATDEIRTTDGTEQKVITANQAIDRDPAFSPGGGKIVFASGRDGDSDLYITNADGSGKPQRLTNAPDGDRFPSWQPIH